MRHRIVLVSLLVLYVFGGLGFLPWYRYQLNPDGISYISIAQKYHRGEFTEAINAYWSPLYSWLLAPIPLETFNVPIRVKSLNLVLGGFILWGFWRLLQTLDIKKTYAYFLTASAIPIVWYQALLFITPDFLLAGLIVGYLGFRLSIQNKNNSWKSLLITGSFGALLYYCKTFGLTWFVIFEFALHLLEARHSRQYISSIKKYVSILIITFLLILPWILTLHAKYGFWTLGKAPLYTYGMFGPTKPLMMIESGPHIPPNATAISGWEDPTSHRFPEWSPFGSSAEFMYQWELLWANTVETFKSYVNFSLFSFVAFLSPLLMLIGSVKIKKRRRIYYLWLAGMFLTLGYLPVRTEERYLWLIPYLTIILIFKLWEVWQNKFKGIAYSAYSLLLFYILFVSALMPTFWLVKSRDTSKQLYLLSHELADLPGIRGGSFASANDWGRSLYTAFFLDGKYYMQMGLEHTYDEAFEKLAKLGVQQYWVWEEKDPISGRTTIFAKPPLTIYEVK